MPSISSVTGTSRHYDSADALDEETMNARIWLGIHFRKAMTDGNQLGHDVFDWGATHFFQPTRLTSRDAAGYDCGPRMTFGGGGTRTARRPTLLQAHCSSG
ncbi:MAG: hypothetical protein ACRD0W_22735 [Acidimicrobiales bacterium]